MEEQRRWSQTLSIDAQRQDKRQQAETEIQESPSKCKTKLFYYECDQRLEQVSQGRGGVSVPGAIKNLTAQNPGWSALADPALSWESWSR